MTVRQMSAQESAQAAYREMLISLKKFYESERTYDAVTAEYLEPIEAQYAAFNQRVPFTAKKLAQQRAARDERQVEAGKRCIYFRERATMLAAVYHVERDWQERNESRQLG